MLELLRLGELGLLFSLACGDVNGLGAGGEVGVVWDYVVFEKLAIVIFVGFEGVVLVFDFIFQLFT